MSTRAQHQAQRTGILLLALLATILVSLLATASFQRKVDTFRWLGFEAAKAEGQWLVTKVESATTGLAAGDRIFMIDGTAPIDLADLRARLHAAPTSAMAVLRGPDLVDVVYSRPPLRIDKPYLVLSLLGVVYLLIGLYTIWKDSTGPSRLFFLWCLTSAGLYLLTPSTVPADPLDEAIFFGDQLARSLLPALTLHLFLVFPSVVPRLRRVRRLTPFLYLPPAAVLALHADWLFFDGRWVAGAATAAKLQALDHLELLMLVAWSIIAVAVLAIRLRNADWEQRRQVQWIALGMLGGYVPFLLLYAIPRVLGLAVADWLAVPAVISLACVPIGFAYAILKYKLWDIGSILRDTIAYSLTALIGVFGFVLINLAISRGVGADLGLLRSLLSFAAGVAIAGVLVPTKGAIASRLERVRYGSRLAQRRALVRLGQTLVYERDLDRLCATVLDHLAAGLEVDGVNLYLAQGGALAPVRLAPRAPRELPFTTFGSGFWRHDVHRIAAVRVPLDRPLPEQRLFAAGYRYAFPLRVRDQRIGIAVLGYRRDEAPLTGEDLSLVRGLLDQAGLALENARLLEEVHQQLEEMSRLEAHNKGIVESSPAGIAVLDTADRVVQANYAFAAIVEVERSEIAGHRLAELLPVMPLPAAGAGPVDVSYCEPSGRERYLQLSVAEHLVAAQPTLRVVVVQDVSERMAMEQALRERERLASLGMVAAGVAHEVNTPLTGISSYAQFLLDDLAADHPHREILEKMERQSFRASQIVNNLLDFARSRGDEAQPVALARVISQAVETIAAAAHAAGVQIVWSPPEADDEHRLRVRGLAGDLEQVLINLLANAIDAMERQAPELGAKILSVQLDEDEGRARIRVVDSGPGIPPERLTRIFEPFFSSKLGSGGTGLGLAISHNIVRRHGGDIQVENRSGERGCVFTVTLPRLLEG